MTEKDKEIQELKCLAKSLGFIVIPRQKWVKKHQCTCGRKNLQALRSAKGVFWKCPKCGKQGPAATNERWAAIAWNEMLEKETAL